MKVSKTRKVVKAAEKMKTKVLMKKIGQILVNNKWSLAMSIVMFTFYMQPPVFAAEVVEKFNFINTLIFGALKVLGGITAAKGVSELGTAWPNRDNAGIGQGVGMIVGGIIIFFVKEILNQVGITV